MSCNNSHLIDHPIYSTLFCKPFSVLFFIFFTFIHYFFFLLIFPIICSIFSPIVYSLERIFLQYTSIIRSTPSISSFSCILRGPDTTNILFFLISLFFSFVTFFFDSREGREVSFSFSSFLFLPSFPLHLRGQSGRPMRGAAIDSTAGREFLYPFLFSFSFTQRLEHEKKQSANFFLYSFSSFLSSLWSSQRLSGGNAPAWRV